MSHRKNLIVGLGVVLLTLLGSVSVAEAQGYPPPYYPPPPPPPPPQGVFRSGLVFGFAGGLGAVAAKDCGDACGAAGFFEGHLGGMVSPRAALMFEIWGGDHPWTDNANNSFETINTFFTAAAQYWLTDILWIKGGAGLAVLREAADVYYNGLYTVDTNDTSGFALFGAGGVEVVQSYNFALDIQLRIGNGFYRQDGNSFNAQNYALMVGFNWY
jgi:hypothetical protein